MQAYASKLFNEYAEGRMNKGFEILDGDVVEILNPKNGLFESYGIYKKRYNKVRLFENRKGSGEFIRSPYYFGKEIVYDPKWTRLTGPILGFDLLLSDKQTESGVKEHFLIEKAKLGKNEKEFLKENKIFGLRRALWVWPTQFHMKFQ